MLFSKVAKLAYKMTPKRKAALAKAVKASAAARKSSFKPISKGTQRRLDKLNKRIAANKLKTNNLMKGTGTVYRVQNKKGEGPLVGKHLRHYATMPLTIKRGYKVAPVSDYNRRRAALIKKLAPKGTPFEEIKFTKGDKFAFSSIKQSEKYFSKAEQAYLKTKGFNLDKISGVKIIGKTSTQVTFRAVRGAPSAAKEAAKLKSKYEKLMKKVN
jgi:hypothetical protein